MKLFLVITQGKDTGKGIPVRVPQFIIGRDPQCQLRPASPLVSKRHCVLLTRGERVFVRDFGSTNGTLVNDEPVKGERELFNDDRLKVGPYVLVIRMLEVAAPQVPAPEGEGDQAAEEGAEPAAAEPETEEVTALPGGSVAAEDSGRTTLQDVPLPGTAPSQGSAPPGESAGEETPAAAARKLLGKFSRRPLRPS